VNRDRDDIIRMARESGLEFHDEISDPWTVLLPELTRFAELVAAAEREACAKVCEAYDDRHPTVTNLGHCLGKQIRERNKHEPR
jgi:hypothetical protein